MRARRALSIAILVLSFTSWGQLFAQTDEPEPEGTSPDVIAQPSNAAAAIGEDVITFREFPLNTRITDQYADFGIVFSGDTPFITTDGSNPTSPVLSGSPKFRGAIVGTFVNPSAPRQPTVVESFAFDAGYFDELDSTRIEWFDPTGKPLGQVTNRRLGIERFEITGGNIASFQISIFRTEPAGYAIDNVVIKQAVASAVFREPVAGEPIDGFPVEDITIPGWNHVGLWVDGIVWESHPGYPGGDVAFGETTTWLDAEGNSIAIVKESGVQNGFTLAAFQHASQTAETATLAFAAIPIPNELAQRMADQIELVADKEYPALSDMALEIFNPESQKGDNARGTFTCVGLVEWSAEEAGHNAGQGFIPAAMESGVVYQLRPNFPIMTPGKLYYAMQNQQRLFNRRSWSQIFQGLLDPVDFMITDPLGRRLGYTQATGLLNEIPGAYYSGDGDIEEFAIPNPLPGTYTIEYVGLDAAVSGWVGDLNRAADIETYLPGNSPMRMNFNVPPAANSPGDVDGSGVIDTNDLNTLRRSNLPRFSEYAGDPSDLNDNGVIDQEDVTILTTLINAVPFTTPAANRDYATTPAARPVVIDVLNNDYDPNGTTLTVTGTTQTDNGRVTINQDGTVTYTANNAFSGSDVFEYTITNGIDAVDGSVEVTVTPSETPWWQNWVIAGALIVGILLIVFVASRLLRRTPTA